VTPAAWEDFAEMTGGASAALTGLLFVAVSLNATRIAEHKALRASAGQTLVLFLTPLIVAAAVLAPGQADWVLGIELIAVALVAGSGLLIIGRSKQSAPDEDRWLIELFDRREPSIVAMLLLLSSGATVAAGANSGLYLLLPAVLTGFTSGVLNAWYFLLPVPPDAEQAAKKRGRRSHGTVAQPELAVEGADPDAARRGGPDQASG
jgi:hypothetical protein